MANINRVVLVGNLTRDPELRHTPSGTAVCKLRIAVNTRQKDAATGEWGDKPNYFDVTVWGNQGESCAQYLAKGRPGRRRRPPRLARVGGAGRHQAPGGRDHRRHVQFLGSRGDGEGGGDGAAAVRPAVATSHADTTTSRRQPARRRRHSVLERESRRHEGRDSERRKRPRHWPWPAAEELLLLQGEDRRGRLQEHQPAPALHLREGQDPLAADHRRVPAAPGPGRGRGQAGARDGAPALRRPS